MDLTETISEVAILKDEAKLSRDARNYQDAIQQLQTAIGLIEASDWQKATGDDSRLSEAQRKLAWHLADCFGMLGGNYRRNKQSDEALNCFRRGSEIEQEPRYQVSSSYNIVNLIVTSIETNDGDSDTLVDLLRKAVEMLERQIFDPDGSDASRRLDRWAWADLGQCKLLLGDLAGAQAAYQQFIALSDVSSIRSSCNVLQNLCEYLSVRKDDKAITVQQGIEFLQSAMK